MSTAIRLQTRSMYLIPLFKDPSHEELQGHCGQQRKKYSRLGSRVAVVATYRQPQLQFQVLKRASTDDRPTMNDVTTSCNLWLFI